MTTHESSLRYKNVSWLGPRAAAPAAAPHRSVDLAIQRVPPPIPPRMQAAAVLGAIVLASAGLALGISGADSLGAENVVRAVGMALGVLLPVAIGLYALRREQTARFGKLLVVVGLAWGPSVLALSRSSVAYSFGRVWAWGVVIVLVYLMLAFPIGRLTRRGDVWLIRLAVASIAGAYLPTALFTDFPEPSPWSSCRGADCPANAFIATHSQPGLVTALEHLRAPLTFAIFVLGAVLVALRWLNASNAARRTQTPVFVVGVLSLSAFSSYLVLRGAATQSGVTRAVGMAIAYVPAVLSGTFLWGLMRWRIELGRTRRKLAPDTADGRASLATVLGGALGDPSLEIAYWGGHERGWLDEDGRPFPVPPSSSVTASTELSLHGTPVALLVHDDSELVESAVGDVVRSVGALTLTNRQIEAEARAGLRELSESRARMLEAIDEDRRRIERDLHDGAQQRLIALKIAADRGAEAAAAMPGPSLELFRRMSAEAAAALEEVRSLARGVYPALLVDHGIVEALSDAADRSSLDVTVRAQGVGRYPKEVEAAVYFCCLEALQNAEKHAHAHSASVDLTADSAIRFEIRDDGQGFDPNSISHTGGLAHMRDRLAVVGGSVRVNSVIGGGTLLTGMVPAATAHVPVEVEQFVLRATEALEPLTICRAVRTGSGTVIDFIVEHANHAACELSGMTRDFQVGKTLGQLHADYPQSSLFRWHCRALTTLEPLAREDVERVAPGGTARIERAVERRAVALGSDRIALVTRDITARKQTQLALELRAQALAGEGAAVCVVRDTSAAILLANREFEHMFGYAENELEGRRAAELAADTLPELSVVPLPPNVFRMRRKDGSEFWSEVTRHTFDDPDAGWCTVEVHRDVTTLRDEEERRLLVDDRLRRALAELPAVAYTTDADLHLTVLFDNLIEPGAEAGRSATAAELFGSSLGAQVAEVNRRVFVTGGRASFEMQDAELGGGLLTVEPVRTSSGAVAGVVGTLLQQELPAAQRGSLDSRSAG